MNTILTADERNRIIDSMGWSLDAQERGDMHRLIQAVLAKLAQQADRQRVPDGWKLVPVEPGEWVFADKVLGHDSHPNHKERMRRLYRAMLAAAPEAPAQASLCPDGLLPDGPVCPRCGIRRGPSGIDGGKWVHCPSAPAQKGGDA